MGSFIFILALLILLIWILLIKKAEVIGNFFVRFIIDPIKGLFE